MWGREAWPQEDGTYLVIGSTFNIKETIKQLGGKWDPNKRGWIVPSLDDARKVARIMVRAKREAFCHEPECTIWVTEEQLAIGYESDPFCSMCDARNLGMKPKLTPLHQDG